ncbi:unnamed protein product [Clavelina lepadiformis]|uniref:Aminoglycoside phosphotransferase domain-containing protein n=1 Tax=Clavelina lepadiformis TaxID=159417 RepID=A0ABP0EWV0_CLALP
MITAQKAKTLVYDNFAVNCVNVKRLDAYIGRNFWLESTSGLEYVLRMKPEASITNTEQLGYYAGQHLHCNGFQVTYPLCAGDGKMNCSTCVENQDGNSDKWLLTLAPFIPGKTITESKLTLDDFYIISKEIGCFAGLVHESLSSYSGTITRTNTCTLDTCTHPEECVWYTRNVGFLLKKFVHVVKESEILRHVNYFLEMFEQNVHPLFSKLRWGVLHGDFSDTNIVLVESDSESQSEKDCLKDFSFLKKKYALIDFEDCHYAPLIFDLCVLLAYMMIRAEATNADPFRVSGLILLGYHKIFPLSENEKKVLFWGVMARLVTSYVMSRCNLLSDPENEAYLCLQSSYCPRLIKLLLDNGEENVMKAWFASIDKA